MNNGDPIGQASLERALWANDLNDFRYLDNEAGKASDHASPANSPQDPSFLTDGEAQTALERALWANDLNDIAY